MNSGTTRIFAALAVVVVAIGLFLVLKPGDSDDGPADPAPATVNATGNETGGTGQGASPAKPEKPAEPAVPTIVVKDGQPVDGVLGIEVDEGDRIEFRVKSDVDEEIHVHGYDISKDVAGGQTAELSFDADITGIFEAELELSSVPIAEIQINP